MPTRVLFSHNYSMADARAGCAAGVYPRQHLFGTDHLDGVAEVVDLAPSGRTGRLHRWIAPRFGDIRQQWQMLRGRRRGDILLSGDFRTLGALLLLRRARMVRTSIVVIAHDAPAGRIDAACLRGADAVICLSTFLARTLTTQLGIPADRVHAAPWGPDLTFAGYRSTGSDHVLSVGKSERDLTTLLTALERTGLPARVYAPDAIRAEWSARLPEVVFRASYPEPARGPLTYDHVLPDLQGAAVFATPLCAVHRPFGLTELDDALALAKPIVMTRNPFIDCDIESIGCGRWVEIGDVDGWVEALTDFMSSRSCRDEAGQRGRAFAERGWNSASFGRVLRDVVQDLTARSRQR